MDRYPECYGSCDRNTTDGDIVVYGIKLNKKGDLLRQRADGVEDRRQVHPGHHNNAVKVQNVPKMHRQSGQRHPNARTEQQQENKRDRNQQQLPGQRNPGHQHHDQDRRQAEAHGNEAGQHPGYGEYVFRDVNLANEGTVDNDG